MEYKSQDIQRTFDISAETVRKWSDEFEQYLSPLANPGTGRHRIFSREDLQVFSIVSQIKNRGGTYEDAHVQLKAGERGDIPTLADERGIVLQASIQLDYAKQQIEILTNQRDEAQSKTTQLETEIVRLNTRLEESGKRITELKGEQTGRDNLLMEIGRLKALLEIARDGGKG